ncbi:MAG: hypothetical protein JRI25_01425 [Deltaproteobacteria bacterium]|nr:hypothetical protein [Deltaproteobacteria bacterium]MBW2253240.1 hypothetical protein [Deltaproteobacteria bacterium]
MRILLAVVLLLSGCAMHVHSTQHRDYASGYDLAPGTPGFCADRQDLCPTVGQARYPGPGPFFPY